MTYVHMGTSSGLSSVDPGKESRPHEGEDFSALSHCHTVTLSHCHTVILSHCHTVTLSHTLKKDKCHMLQKRSQGWLYAFCTFTCAIFTSLNSDKSFNF